MHAKNLSVNYCKGLAIILMVLLHSSRWIETSLLGNWISLFHMPLFFIMSGYCFKENYLTDFKSFVFKRIKGLWIPFVKYGIIFLLLHNVFYYFHIYDNIYGSCYGEVSSLYDFNDYVLHLQRILRMVDMEQLLGGYWFLPALLYASLISYTIIRYIHSHFMGGYFCFCL